MALERYAILLISPELDPYYQMHFSIIALDTPFWKGPYSSAGVQSVNSNSRQQDVKIVE